MLINQIQASNFEKLNIVLFAAWISSWFNIWILVLPLYYTIAFFNILLNTKLNISVLQYNSIVYNIFN